MTKGIRILAALAIVLGATSLYTGMHQQEKFSNKVKKKILGETAKETKLYVYGGVILIVVGLGALGASFYKKRRHH